MRIQSEVLPFLKTVRTASYTFQKEEEDDDDNDFRVNSSISSLKAHRFVT